MPVLGELGEERLYDQRYQGKVKYVNPDDEEAVAGSEVEPYLGTPGFDRRIAPDRWQRFPYKTGPGYHDYGGREYGVKLGTAATCAIVPPFTNYLNSLPLMKAGWKMIPFGVGGYLFGTLIWLRFKKRTAEKDAQFRYYMSIHEDKFHMSCKKLKDTYRAWKPQRTI